MAGTPMRRLRRRNPATVTEHRVEVVQADDPKKVAATLTEMLNDDSEGAWFWEFNGPVIYEPTAKLWYCTVIGWREVELEN